MSGFISFEQWIVYWRQQYMYNRNEWIEQSSHGIDDEIRVGRNKKNHEEQFVCTIKFDTGGWNAYDELRMVQRDCGDELYPLGFVNTENYADTGCWSVWKGCPDLPLVIQVANKYGGNIIWWNSKILDVPPKAIPLPPNPKKEKSGCYIATAVYGSYECPEVWTLRRFRDNKLAKVWYGRMFIRCYYSVSPFLVKWFGSSSWFKRLFRKPLDSFVAKLKIKGFSSSPYLDQH